MTRGWRSRLADAVLPAGGAVTAAVAVLALLTAGCGNSIYTTSPNSSSTPLQLEEDEPPLSPTPDVSITSAGFKPQVLHVEGPETVVFTNDDTVTHTLRNAPQLGWDNCPEMNEPLTLAPGAVGRVAFSEHDAVCTYDDADQPSNEAFQGYISLH
jgi:plastocyanin